ncbi:dual oxidase 1-like [Dysidea avara]|uniref:dual oxidase 1-like n=1 Tax=Dysidea avara TaxID=196820 RepID=UPI0033339DA8
MARLLAGFFALYLITTAYAGPFGSHENILVVDEIYEGRNLSLYFAEEGEYEYESYDGWYNNPAHPDWGGADMPLERKVPIHYLDGVYDLSGYDRPNVLVISNLTFEGLTGRGSDRRTSLFTFYGQQVVEEVLDAQRPGCPPEYENMKIPICHPLYDPYCRGDLSIPFLRTRYSFLTGYNPNNPRQQLNEITPWMDGGLVYGPFKAWADVLRSFKDGQLAHVPNPPFAGRDTVTERDIHLQVPRSNEDFGLPFINPPPPANHSLFEVNRFWTIGNPRGNENAFLLTMGIFWFRVHNWWALQLKEAYGEEKSEEFLFNRARHFTIATYQHVTYNEWLPLFLEDKFRDFGGRLPPYNANPGYSAYFESSTGYNPAINPQIAHIYQSAAMRFGHTMVTPANWRRRTTFENGRRICYFGPTVSNDASNSHLEDHSTANNRSMNYVRGSYFEIVDRFYDQSDQDGFNYISERITTTGLDLRGTSNESRTYTWVNPDDPTDTETMTYRNDPSIFAVRTCQSYFNPQETIKYSNIGPFIEGMASGATEREDFIITPDLRGQVFGPLDFSRRDLMAINLQRARDHGLPDYNTARFAYGLVKLNGFEQINPYYGIDDEITAAIERIRDAYGDDISKCDIWACGMAETTTDGPGELFSEILFDQFMRIRHADRFWYEDYRQNELFNEEEIQSITQLTFRDLILLVTDIHPDALQDNPFEYIGRRNDGSEGPSAPNCPQPFQLSELWTDDCRQLETFDYFTESDYQIPLIWGLCFIYAAACIMVLFLLAAYNQHRTAKLLASGRPSRAKKIEGTDLVDGTGGPMVALELRAGIKSETRTVSIKFGPGKQMTLYYGSTVYRKIDLRNQIKITIQRAFDDGRLLCLKIPHEYDTIIQCYSHDERATMIQKIEAFLDEIQIGHEIEEPVKGILLASAFTKKQRQQLLEAFFKAVFSENAQEQTQAGSVVRQRKDVLDCELTREEFAEAMSLKADSLFVDQMFQLIDQDGNGFVSFREFLDMIVIFSRGSPEDKLKLMFDMYDVDKSGSLSREEFRNMLKGMMELVNASVSPDQLDQLIDSMFAAAGFQNKQQLTLEDFNVLLRDHKEELHNARLNITGYDVDVPDASIKKEQPEDDQPSRYRQRETAPARARRTIIKAYSRTTKTDPRGGAPAEPTVTADIPTTTRSRPSTGPARMFASFKRWIENYKLHIFYLSMFFLVTGAIFVERAYYYSVEREHGGLRRIAGYGVTVTRGAASCMMWTYSILLLTMARNFITYLRETPLNQYVPFDAAVSFHKIIALTALFFTIMHAIGHGINFYHISTQTANDLTCLFREVFHRTHQLPKFSYWLFLTATGFSGFILSLITVVIYVFAVQYARRYVFQAFWFTHHWYYVFYIFMFLHGSGRLVQDPLFGNFFLGPAIVFAIDQLISVGRNKVEIVVVRADLLPSQVIGIYFKRPITFEYKAGQWVRIASLAQNPGEYHPFTLTSAPHEEHLSLHIRAVGPWTQNFRESFNPSILRGQPYPKLLLDGPFGEGHQDWYRFDVAIMVGGGIGVTPFASILKELVNRFSIGARVQSKKVYFIWVTRTQHQFEWLTDIIREVEEKDVKNLVEIHIFITQFFDKFDLRTTMLYICERHFQKISGKSLFTGLRSVTHFGRPDFNRFFDNLQEEHFLVPKIGVFSCGPPGMTKNVEAACAATNRYEGPAFHHHYENF